MRVLEITLKDLIQILRDRRALFFLAAMPIGFTLFMGFAYRSGGDGGGAADRRLTLGWANEDPGGGLAEALYARLAASDALILTPLAPAAVDEAVRNGQVAGALVVPAGFSAQTEEGARPRPLKLVANPATAAGQSLFQLVRAPVTQVMSAVEIARLSAEAVSQPGDPAEIAAARAVALRAWAETDSGAWVRVELATAPQPVQWYGDNPYNQASPGILVQFAIFGLVTSGQILVQERKTRTLQRMQTTSLRPAEIVAGHLLAMFGVVFAQEALLIVFGQLALGVNYAREPLATLLIAVGLGLWIAALGLFIGVLARDDSQVVLFALAAMFVFSALGGAWFPLEGASGLFGAVGRLMPSAWAMTGYQNLLIRGLGLASAWLPTLVLLTYAAGFFGLAVWRFKALLD